MAYSGLIMFLGYFKRLALGIKAKNCGNNHGPIKFKWKVTKTHRTDIKRILVFGDSNSFRPEGSKTSWPRLLEDKDPLRYKVFNESCDGRTTRYDIGERNGFSVVSKKLAENAPLDYVFIMLGTNDVKRKYGPPSTAEIVDGMRQILDLVKTNGYGAKSILLTPPPIGNVSFGELSGAQKRIPPIVAEYRLLAMNSNFRMIDIYSVIDSDTDLESDMIHLNEIGRKKVAGAVWSYLQGENA